MPEFFSQAVQVKPSQDIEESFRSHVSSEDLSPSLFQFTVANFTQEGEGAQFNQIITDARVLVL